MSTTDPRQERTLGQLVASATQDISTLVRGEIALAKLEIGAQVKKAGIGGGLLAAAGVVAFYSVYFIFTTIAEGIQALGLSRWLSYLIVTVFMLLVAGVLALIGVKKMKTIEPVPERTIANAEQTVEGLKSALHTPHAQHPGVPAESDLYVTPHTQIDSTPLRADRAATRPIDTDPAVRRADSI